MVKFLVSIFDKKVQVFGNPVIAMNEADAVRMARTVVSSDDSQISLYPEDFTLYHVGNFNDATGVLEPINPIILTELVSLVKLYA